jgi:hypothetical protein
VPVQQQQCLYSSMYSKLPGPTTVQQADVGVMNATFKWSYIVISSNHSRIFGATPCDRPDLAREQLIVAKQLMSF